MSRPRRETAPAVERGARARSRVTGVVLAAGAGTRYGHPKALARDRDGTPWVVRVVDALTDAGCHDVLVALGAARHEAATLVPATARVVAVTDWAEGLAATLRAALAAVAAPLREPALEPDLAVEARSRGAGNVDAVLVVPVDVPDLPASVCRRLLALAAPDALARAVYRGEPGHPVLIGREHWPELARTAEGDRGAAPYLRAHGALAVECADLWHGADVDAPR